MHHGEIQILVPGGAFRNCPYAACMYSHEELRRRAQWVVDNLERFGPVDFVAVTGKSGMAVAFAALALKPFPLITVRKGEASHGDMVEGTAPAFGRYIVVDDFVSTGSTLRRIHKELTRAAHDRGWQAPEMVGALMYDGGHGEGRIDGRRVRWVGY